jgi:Zn-dependent peptidase ImmA (M78 family)/transcriptional regulator with XRE-family HTH domain
MSEVSPKVLQWARKKAGLSLPIAAKSLGIRSQTRLESVERGDQRPSASLLERMAKVYRVPLVALYLSEPPTDAERIEDYRTLPQDRSPADEALIDALVRDVEARQGMIKSLMEDADEAHPRVFISSSSMADGVTPLVESIRSTLGIKISELWEKPDPNAVFAALREAAERAGVIVILKGDLGSHQTAIEVDAFRGLSLSDPIAPMVVINDNDAHSAWSFTLLHELAHLWLGQSAVSDQSAARREERFCNDIAGEFLLPRRALDQLQVDDLGADALYQSIQQFAEARNLSSSMVAYRLFRAKRIAQHQWEDVRNRSKNAWEKSKAEQKRRRGKKSGPDYYVVRRHRLGNHLISFVSRMLAEGALTTSKAARILGVKPTTVHTLIERAA